MLPERDFTTFFVTPHWHSETIRQSYMRKSKHITPMTFKNIGKSNLQIKYLPSNAQTLIFIWFDTNLVGYHKHCPNPNIMQG